MRLSSVRNHWLARLAELSLLVGLLIAVACTEVSQSTDSDGDGGGTGGTAGTGAPSCTAPTQVCSGSCVNTSTDAANCGSCGNACVAGEVCQAGNCMRTCLSPQVDCSGMCADPSSNALHCGGCNRPCQGGQICQGSACVNGSCPAGQMLCGGACVDLTSSLTNCGACGNACLVSQSCQSGVCMSTGGTGGTGGGAGAGGSGGAAGATTAGMGGMSTGGGAGAGAGGTAGMSGGMGGAGRGGMGGSTSGGAGTSGTAGAAGGVTQSTTCPNITWPQSTGSRSLGGGMTVTNHDGGMQIHNGTLNNCANGDQDSTTPLITVQNGGSVRNVIMGNNVGDGIHCLGSCTIENVWFPYVCDDAITILGSGTVTIRNSGFRNARDKTIQHNGSATVTLDNILVETAGKLYRSCGEGCESSAARTATIQNVVAIGVDQVAGISTNDRVTLRNICTYRTFSICSMYDPGTSDETENGVNQSNEGPSTNCIFTANDTHALLSRVTGIPFTTQSVCGGPNGYKSGSTATSCVSGFNSCLKSCMPGGYGFKQINCTNNRYAEGTGVICAMPTDTTAAMNLAPSRVMAATTNVEDNAECSTQWAIGREASNNNNYCVCVYKPGYYSNSNWLAWDCQPRWW